MYFYDELARLRHTCNNERLNKAFKCGNIAMIQALFMEQKVKPAFIISDFVRPMFRYVDLPHFQYKIQLTIMLRQCLECLMDSFHLNDVQTLVCDEIYFFHHFKWICSIYPRLFSSLPSMLVKYIEQYFKDYMVMREWAFSQFGVDLDLYITKQQLQDIVRSEYRNFDFYKTMCQTFYHIERNPSWVNFDNVTFMDSLRNDPYFAKYQKMVDPALTVDEEQARSIFKYHCLVDGGDWTIVVAEILQLQMSCDQEWCLDAFHQVWWGPSALEELDRFGGHRSVAISSWFVRQDPRFLSLVPTTDSYKDLCLDQV